MSSDASSTSKILSDQQVLELVERIVSDDFCELMEITYPTLKGDHLQAVDKLRAIYRMTHSHSRSHSCYGIHSDWRTEAKEWFARQSESEGDFSEIPSGPAN